jgi:hypothetical protein
MSKHGILKDMGEMDLAVAVAGVATSMRDDAPASHVLAALSDLLRPVLPHDRLVVDHLDENRRTFRVFAEHVVRGPVLHEEHYTTDAGGDARYTVAEWAIRPVFDGEARSAAAGSSWARSSRPA